MLHAGYATFMALFLLSPLWTPVACAFWAIWREDLTRKMMVTFGLAEGVAFGLCYLALRAIGYAA